MSAPSPKDCANMLFNVATLNSPADIYDTWPELRYEPAFEFYFGEAKTESDEEGEGQETPNHQFTYQGLEGIHLVYTIWLYDMNSPIIKTIPELDKRRVTAAELSMLIEYPAHFQKALQGNNELVNQMADAYIRLQNHSKYEAITSLEIFVHNQWDIVRQKIPFNVAGLDSDKIIRANEIQAKCAEAAYKNTERLEKMKADFITEQKELFGEVVVEAESKFKNKLHKLADQKKQGRRKSMTAMHDAAPIVVPEPMPVFESTEPEAPQQAEPKADVPQARPRPTRPVAPTRQ